MVLVISQDIRSSGEMETFIRHYVGHIKMCVYSTELFGEWGDYSTKPAAVLKLDLTLFIDFILLLSVFIYVYIYLFTSSSPLM